MNNKREMDHGTPTPSWFQNTAGQPAADIDLDWIFAYQPLPAFTSRECMRDIDPVYALPLDLDQRRSHPIRQPAHVPRWQAILGQCSSSDDLSSRGADAR